MKGTDMRERARASATAALALFAMSCGGSPEPGQPTVQSITRDLALGAQGSDVEAVNDYLTQFGYFPNQDLQSQYPTWRPIVAEGPAARNAFDEHTAAAVLAFQGNMGLAKTGVVDADTRAIMQEMRCGVPDGIVTP